MNTPTLSQLADIGAKAAAEQFASEQDDSVGMYILSAAVNYPIDAPAREAFAKAVLDAVGYKFPVDPEREDYEKWAQQEGPIAGLFEAWKAGRDNLREASGKTQAAKPAPETFEAHGLTWFKHTPGDPMPCDGADCVTVLLYGGIGVREKGATGAAKERHWGVGTPLCFRIIGWRYAAPPADAP